MAHIIKQAPFQNHVDEIIDRQIRIDRIICDFPSFAGRWPGVPDEQTLDTLLSKLQKLLKSNVMSPDSTITISFTGIAQEKFDAWMDREGKNYIEHMPDEDFTCFFNYLMDLRTRAMFVGRRDIWACTRTYRKVGSNYKPNDVEPITNVPSKFDDFPYPESRDLYTIHSYRSPVHHGINEAREDLVWTENQGLDNIELANKFLRRPQGCMVNFNRDRHKFTHKASMVHKAGPYITDKMFDALTSREFDPGLFRMNRSNWFHLAMWMVERYSNEGENVYNPFMETGELAAAIMISKRNLIGVEYNLGRTERVLAMHKQLLTLM